MTGDEVQKTMGRRKKRDPFSPSRLSLRVNFHKERETSGYKADFLS